MTSPDLLGEFWRHPCLIRRWVGDGAYGPVFDPPADSDPVTVLGFVHDGTKLIADGTGGQVASSAQVAFPASTPYIPIRSQVTLPDQFSPPGATRTTTVIDVGLADGAGLPTPDHLQVSLL